MRFSANSFRFWGKKAIRAEATHFSRKRGRFGVQRRRPPDDERRSLPFLMKRLIFRTKYSILITAGNAAVVGASVIQRYEVGKGCVYILGTVPDYQDMRRLIAEVCARGGVECGKTEGNSILVSQRRGVDRSGIILAEIGGTGGIYHADKTFTDLLTGKKYQNDITLEPYQVLLLEEK